MRSAGRWPPPSATSCPTPPKHSTPPASARSADPPDLWATINGSQMLTALKAPGQLNTRWLSEDVPYGLRAWSGLGTALGVPTPVIDAVITLGLTVLHEPLDTNYRTLGDLGLEGMTRDQMLNYAREG